MFTGLSHTVTRIISSILRYTGCPPIPPVYPLTCGPVVRVWSGQPGYLQGPAHMLRTLPTSPGNLFRQRLYRTRNQALSHILVVFLHELALHQGKHAFRICSANLYPWQKSLISGKSWFALRQWRKRYFSQPTHSQLLTNANTVYPAVQQWLPIRN